MPMERSQVHFVPAFYSLCCVSRNSINLRPPTYQTPSLLATHALITPSPAFLPSKPPLAPDKTVGGSYYWCCEGRKSLFCKGRAISQLSNGHHVLKKFTDHNRSPSVNAINVSKAMHEVKRQARESQNLPCQIIQHCTTSVPLHVAADLPSNEAMRQRIKRARHEQLPAEPGSLGDIEIPAALRVTLSGELFLIKDRRVGENGFLMFTTVSD
ncbi:hypothetical protein D918_10030, partial [Trichuris suis]